MGVNWSLGQQPNIIGNALGAFQAGRQDREQAEQRNALLDIRRQEGDQRQAEYADKQKATKREEHIVLGKLLDHAKDEPSYQQSLAAAKQYGIDTTGAPPNFDPNWVGQQKLIVGAFAKDGGQAMSAEARRLKEAGYSDEDVMLKMREFVNKPDYMAIPAEGTLVNTRDPAAVAQFAASQGGEDEWEVVTPGGAGGNASGGFQP